MKPRYLILGFALFLVVIFTAANWQLVLQQSTLNLVFATVTAPLGVVLLCVIGGVALVYQAVLLRTETQLLLESRRAGKETDGLRRLAETAESSRFESLRNDLVDGIGRVTERFRRVNETLDNIGERIGKVDGTLGKVDARLKQLGFASTSAAPEHRKPDLPVQP